MHPRRVYIVHGYMASHADHWFDWLANQLEPHGIETVILDMPDSGHPDAATWIGYLQRHIHTHDERTILVGHSLGCIALLRHLDTVAPASRIGGLILVSGFAESLPQYPRLDAFTEPGFDTDRIVHMASQRAVFVSDDDPIVPPGMTRRLAHRLDAKLHTVAHAGHFMASDGYTEFPLLKDALLALPAAAPQPPA